MHTATKQVRETLAATKEDKETMITITDNNIKAEYLEKHLPYRINSMLAHDLIMHRKTLAHCSLSQTTQALVKYN